MRRRIQRYFDRRKVIKAVGSFDEAALLQAVETGNKVALELLLEGGISPNCHNAQGQPALLVAIHHRQILSLSLLAQHGADLNHCDMEQQTPLMFAIRSADKYSFHQLLSLGADPNLPDHEGQTALMLAATAPTAIYVRELLEAGAEVDAQNHAGKTALLIAAEAGRTTVIKALLEAGADPSIKDVQGNSVFQVTDLPLRTKELLAEARTVSGGNEAYFPLPQKLSSFLSGILDESLRTLNESDSLIELEEKGRQLISTITSDEQIATWIGQLEDTQLQEEITWVLNLLVEIREILHKQQLLLQQNQWQEAEARRNWQKQVLWLAQSYHHQLDQALEKDVSQAE